MVSPLRRRADPRPGARPCPPHSLSPNLPNGVCRSQTGRSTPFPAASSALPLPAVPASSSSTRPPPAPTCADLVRLADCAFRHRMLPPTVLRRQDLASLPSPHSLSPDIPGGICRRQTGAERPLPAALSTLPPAARPPTVTTRLSPQTAWADPRPHAFLPSTTPDAPPLRPAPSGGTPLPPFSVPKHPGAVCFSQVRASAPFAARVTRHAPCRPRRGHGLFTPGSLRSRPALSRPTKPLRVPHPHRSSLPAPTLCPRIACAEAVAASREAAASSRRLTGPVAARRAATVRHAETLTRGDLRCPPSRLRLMFHPPPGCRSRFHIPSFPFFAPKYPGGSLPQADGGQCPPWQAVSSPEQAGPAPAVASPFRKDAGRGRPPVHGALYLRSMPRRSLVRGCHDPPGQGRCDFAPTRYRRDTDAIPQGHSSLNQRINPLIRSFRSPS